MLPVLCLFTDSLEPSGVGVHMLALSAALRHSYRIVFACPPTPGGAPLLLRAQRMGITIHPLRVRGGGRPQPLDWLRTERVAIFHAHAGIAWEGHAGVAAARAAGVPVVLRTEHLPYLITDRVQQDHYRDTLRLVDRVVCVSEGVRASFQRAGVPVRLLHVIHNGIALPPRVPSPPARERLRTALGLRPDDHLVLTVGRMTEQKGYGDLLEAIPTVIRHVPQARFLWAGDGPLREALRARIRAQRLAAHVHLLGRRDDVPGLIAAADLFVLPSRFEGLPLAALEAMAAGVPVIGTRVCGLSEVICDGVTGRLVTARDSVALAAAIQATLEQPGIAAAWGRAGRLRVEREFSAARMTRETAALYEELCREKWPRHERRYLADPLREIQGDGSGISEGSDVPVIRVARHEWRREWAVSGEAVDEGG